MRLVFFLSTIIISFITTINLKIKSLRHSDNTWVLQSSSTKERINQNGVILNNEPKCRRPSKIEHHLRSTSAKDRTKRSITGVLNITDDECLKFSSCAIAERKTKWYCQCDEDCLEYDDCCYDYEGGQPMANKGEPEANFYLCSRLSRSRFGIYSISSCPKSVSNITLRKMCSVGNDHLATFLVVHKKTKVYKNMYCALCHNVTDFEYFYKEVSNLRYGTFSSLLSVSSKHRNEILMGLSKKADNIPPPGAKLRYCFLNLVTTNNSLCMSYISPVIDSAQIPGIVYRNVHCMGNSEEKQCIKESTLATWDRNPDFLSKIMFSIYPEKLEEGCDTWSEEIFQTERCKGEPLLTNALTMIEMSWISVDELPSSLMMQIGVLTPWLFASKNLVEVTSLLSVKASGNRQAIEVVFYFVYKKSAFIKEYQHFIDQLYLRNVTLLITSVANFSQTELQLIRGSHINCSINAKCETLLRTDMTRVSVHEAMANVKVSINSLSVNILSQNLVIRASYINEELIINNILQDRTITPSSWSLPMVVTNACFAISFAALLVLIIVQRKSNLVDNIPSSNIENISVSLALSNITFIVGSALSGLSKICYAIGVAQHYLWLTVFTFMTISVIWIGATLTKIRARKRVNSGSTFRRRLAITVFGLVVPLAFVCPALVIDVYGYPYWSPGYGSGACFPNRYPSNLVFFTGPIILALTANMAILIYIICKVCAVRLGAANIRKLSPYQDALIYLRIVVLSGVLWFTGIIASLFDAEWINYLFTLLCGLQGLFLSLGTLTSKKVRFKSRRKENTSETN